MLMSLLLELQGQVCGCAIRLRVSVPASGAIALNTVHMLALWQRIPESCPNIISCTSLRKMSMSAWVVPLILPEQFF